MNFKKNIFLFFQVRHSEHDKRLFRFGIVVGSGEQDKCIFLYLALVVGSSEHDKKYIEVSALVVGSGER